MKRIFVTLLAALAICSCNGGYQTLGGYAQGGTYSVKYNAHGVKVPRAEVQERVDAILDSIDRSASGYNKGSLLSRMNRGERVAPDRTLAELLQAGKHYADITGGALDVSAAPLFDIWGFGFTTDSLPSAERILEAMERCSMSRLHGLENIPDSLSATDLLSDDSGVAPVFNFNAIAQGYSCDRIAEYLHSIGVKDMLVNIGEIYCEGLSPRGEGWKIGIDTPTDGNNSPGESLSGIWQGDGRACGVVTSGNYRKFYVKDGRKYAHTIDPRTGYPVSHSLLSATVIAPDALTADAMATYFMVIGPLQAAQAVLADPELEACLISADSTWVSPGFNSKGQ